MFIDPHVHCRDDDWAYKETVGHSLEVADKAGVDAIFDMPNTSPVITTRERVVERLELAKSLDSDVFYGLYVGLTPDPEQVRGAVKIHRKFFPKKGSKVGVVGLKLFAGKSVGDLGVVEEKEQREVYRVLGGYEGVLAVHCEKESLFVEELWDPKYPVTHCLARPAKAELESIKNQVEFAWTYGLKGVLHIAHVSTPESVDYIDQIRKNLGTSDVSRLKITCGVTPHHLFYCEDDIVKGKEGPLFKVNPPLRTREQQKGLLKCLKQGKIDWIETDHAPHTLEDKFEKHMSGIPWLDYWPDIADNLRSEGLTEAQINNLTFYRAKKTFGIDIERREGYFKERDGTEYESAI